MNDIISAKAPAKENRVKPFYRDLREPLSIHENMCLKYGYENGRELCIFIDKNSNKVISKVISDSNLRCYVANILKRLDTTKQYIQIHNHFDNIPISSADIHTFINNKMIDEVRVVSESKTFIMIKKDITRSSNLNLTSFSKIIQTLTKIYIKKMVIKIKMKLKKL